MTTTSRPFPSSAFLISLALIPIAIGCRARDSSRNAPEAASRIRRASGAIETYAQLESHVFHVAVRSDASITIGRTTGDSVYLLDHVVAGRLLSGGEVAIADGGVPALRFYDASGTWVTTSGTWGAGPGEFRELTWVGRCDGDSVFAYDPANWRITVFDQAGRTARMFAPTLPESRVPPYSVSCGAGMVVLEGWAMQIPSGEMATLRGTVPIVLTDTRGNVVSHLGMYRGPERVALGHSVAPLRFGARTEIAAGGGFAYIGLTDQRTIEQYGSDGQPVRQFRIQWPRRQVTDRDAAHYEDSVLSLARTPQQRAAWARQVLPRPDSFPVYGSMEVDALGCLWVEDYARPQDRSPRRWLLFDRAGHVVATAETPWGLDVLDISMGAVLGVRLDSLQTQHVELHRMTKETVSRRERMC